MATGQAESNTEKAERAKDKRLRKKFGITLERFNQYRSDQCDRCKICGGSLFAYGPPHTDHFHFKIEAMGTKGQEWTATALDELGTPVFAASSSTKAGAVKEVKLLAMPWSVRGLLCFKCNKALGVIARLLGAESNPDILLSVREYLIKRLTKR
jgi:Recombination endonuclease VII